MIIEIPNEGATKPIDIWIIAEEQERGDTWNIHAPCTITLGETIRRHGRTIIRFTISDIKYEEPNA